MEEKTRAMLLTWAILIALSLLAVACNCAPKPSVTSFEAREPNTEASSPKEPPPPSVVTPVVEAPPTPTLVFGYTEQGDEKNLILLQLGVFSDTYGIGVEGHHYGTPDALVDAFLAGQVHVAALAYNQVGLLYKKGVLMYLDEGARGFRTDALESVTFGELGSQKHVYGLPWRRSACMRHYYYLVVHSAAPDPGGAWSLIEFLTHVDQQKERRALPGWFPTLQCCYEAGACYPDSCGQEISCPELPPPLLLPPEQITPTIALANERLPHLDAVLGQIRMNTAGAVSLLDNGERQSTAAALADPVPTDEFRNRLYTEGAYVGALFVDSDPEYPPGDYAVRWKCDRQPCTEPNSQVKVYLIPPGLKGKPRVIPVQFESFEDTGGQVGPPFSQVEQGSYRFCWHVDSRRGCIRIGKQR